MKTIVVTAGDEKYSQFLLDLLESLLRCRKFIFNSIGVLDVGLSQSTKRNVAAMAAEVIDPGWDLDVDQGLKIEGPHLRAKTARPFLPKYFPGYDLYLWLDADAWVQEEFALAWLVEAAQSGAMGLVPLIDRSYEYPLPLQSVKWRSERLSGYYGDRAESDWQKYSYYNSGAFSMRADSPHWRIWADCFAEGLKANPTLVTDQTALNRAIWTHALPVHPLPALCNWCCHHGAPILDVNSGKLCEPHIPYAPIGIVHMTGDSKHATHKVRRGEEEISYTFRFRRASKTS
jgi:hypothetical protein